MSDDIRRLSEELARDPSSIVFLQLGEALRRSAQLDLALRVASRGVERHTGNADAHDLLARVRVDRGMADRARPRLARTARGADRPGVQGRA